MNSRLKVIVVTAGLLFAAFAAVRTQQQNPYRLKEPDQRKLCLECHGDFQDTLNKKFVHSAVQSGECASCHSPHVSSHGKLLSAEPGRICATCHDGVVPATAKSIHKVAGDGECAKCHDPHASDNPANLLAKGNDLCLGCHKTVAESIARAKFRHRPVEQGCLSCHNPHASEKAGSLLHTAVPELCVKCHKPDAPAFVTRHMRYPVGKADCTSCHDPHGSSQPALLLDSVHPPVANRTCVQCHEPAESATPFATKRSGYELCKGCHNEMVTATFAKARLHWPVADQAGCGNCHNPHASRHGKLLKAETATLCRTCHADTARKIAGIESKHVPVAEGQCTSCHTPHSAANAFLIDQPSVNEMCGTCHDYGQHSSHPLGEKAVDPRNRNLRVSCLSCHDGHGTPHKHMLLAATNVELCTPCHKQYSR
jgi:predicted CXXCH cytochrome family protein